MKREYGRLMEARMSLTESPRILESDCDPLKKIKHHIEYKPFEEFCAAKRSDIRQINNEKKRGHTDCSRTTGS